MKSYNILLVAIAIFFSSCKTKQNFVIMHDTVSVDRYHNVIKHDSIHTFDSILISRVGDTITIFKSKIMYKYKFFTDTVKTKEYILKNVPVDREVIKYRHDFIWWLGLGIIILVGLYSIFRFSRIKLK